MTEEAYQTILNVNGLLSVISFGPTTGVTTPDNGYTIKILEIINGQPIDLLGGVGISSSSDTAISTVPVLDGPSGTKVPGAIPVAGDLMLSISGAGSQNAGWFKMKVLK